MEDDMFNHTLPSRQDYAVEALRTAEAEAQASRMEADIAQAHANCMRNLLINAEDLCIANYNGSADAIRNHFCIESDKANNVLQGKREDVESRMAYYATVAKAYEAEWGKE